MHFFIQRDGFRGLIGTGYFLVLPIRLTLFYPFRRIERKNRIYPGETARFSRLLHNYTTDSVMPQGGIICHRCYRSAMADPTIKFPPRLAVF